MVPLCHTRSRATYTPITSAFDLQAFMRAGLRTTTGHRCVDSTKNNLLIDALFRHQVCLEFSGIQKGGSTGKIKETHAVADKAGNVVRQPCTTALHCSSVHYAVSCCRYTITGTVALAAPPPDVGSNGTANFSSTQVSLDLVIPSSNHGIEASRVAPLGDPKTGGQARACQLGVNADSSILTLDCNPPSSTRFGYMGYEVGWKRPSAFTTTKRNLWQDPPKLLKKPENCHHIMGPKYKDQRFQDLAAPTTTSYVLRVTLSGQLADVTAAKKTTLEAAVAAIGGVPSAHVKLDSIQSGSVVAQFRFTRQEDLTTARKAAYDKWVLSTDTDNMRLDGMLVLAASFFKFKALGFYETKSKVPAWATWALVLSALTFLCWVLYTVRCRHVVLELEKNAMAEAGKARHGYARVPGRERPPPRASTDSR